MTDTPSIFSLPLCIGEEIPTFPANNKKQAAFKVRSSFFLQLRVILKVLAPFLVFLKLKPHF